MSATDLLLRRRRGSTTFTRLQVQRLQWWVTRAIEAPAQDIGRCGQTKCGLHDVRRTVVTCRSQELRGSAGGEEISAAWRRLPRGEKPTAACRERNRKEFRRHRGALQRGRCARRRDCLVGGRFTGVHGMNAQTTRDGFSTSSANPGRGVRVGG